MMYSLAKISDDSDPFVLDLYEKFIFELLSLCSDGHDKMISNDFMTFFWKSHNLR